MYGVLSGGVFDGPPLTLPRGVVKSPWGNHQLELELIPIPIPIPGIGIAKELNKRNWN